jgi:hypothetical protein
MNSSTRHSLKGFFLTLVMGSCFPLFAFCADPPDCIYIPYNYCMNFGDFSAKQCASRDKCTRTTDLVAKSATTAARGSSADTPALGKPEQPSDGSATPKTTATSGAKQAFTDQATNVDDKARDAAIQRDRYDLTLFAAEKYEQRRLQEAQRTLREKAAAIASSSGNSDSGQSAIIHDAGVIDKVASKFQAEKPITKADADSAQIPEIRDQLKDLVLTQSYGEKLTKDRAKLSDTINSLVAISALAKDKVENLGTAPRDGRGRIASAIDGTGIQSSSKIANFKNESSSDGDLGQREAPTPTGEDSTGSTEISKMLKAVAGMKSVDGPSLRDRLRKKMALARAAEDAKLAALKSGGGKDIFEGGLSKEGAAAANDPTRGAGSSLAAQAVSSALRSSSSEQERFTLAGAETDAAVQKLMRVPSGTELAASDASVLAANTLSLFERVRVAHAHCLKQHCVQAN